MVNDRRNVLKVGNVHSVNSVNRNFPMSIEQVCIGQAVSSNDGGQVGEKEDGIGWKGVESGGD